MLDVHPPEHAPHTVRDFFLHIFTITIGLLIALGLEALVEWRHHVHLGHEAELNMRKEIEDNQQDLRYILRTLPGQQKSMYSMLGFLKEKQQGHSTDRKEVTLGLGISTPRSSSWTTATATGTLNYMDYDRVKRFADAYGLQKKVEEAQDAALVPETALMGVVGTGDPNQLSPEDATAAISQVRLLIAQEEDILQLGAELDKAYTKALQD